MVRLSTVGYVAVSSSQVPALVCVIDAHAKEERGGGWIGKSRGQGLI